MTRRSFLSKTKARAGYAALLVVSLVFLSSVGGTTVASGVIAPINGLASIPICAAPRTDKIVIAATSNAAGSRSVIYGSRDVVEFSIPDGGKSTAGSTHEIAFAPDGSTWVTQQAQARLVHMNSSGDMTFHDLPTGSGPHGIGFDPTGRLWITLEFANEIVRIGLDGEIVERYRIPLAGAGPHGLAVAPDGRVWWTGKQGGVVGFFIQRLVFFG